jgi:integrase/recombinase XerD
MPRNARAAAVPPDLREGIDAFLGHLSLERGLAKLTVAAYEGDLLAFAAHCGRAGQTRWADVGLAQVDAWVRVLDRRGQAPASLARRLSAVR